MQVSSRDGQEMLLTSIELGDNSPSLQSGTSCLEAVLCSGAATERQHYVSLGSVWCSSSARYSA